MQTEVLEETELKTSENKSSKLFLLNDDWNSFDWIIECLIKICGHSSMQAEQCAMIAHSKGECHIKSGNLEQMKGFKDSLELMGIGSRIE